MSKNKSKGKGKRPSHAALNEDTLAQLTSRIDQNLNDKDHKRKNPPSDASPAQKTKKQKSAPKSLNSEDYQSLLAEVKALGGDEGDMDLIGGLDDSEDEYEQGNSAPVDKKLRDELAALSKELGFAELPAQADSEDEQAEAEDEDEEAEEDGDDDEDEDEEEESEDDRDEEKVHESRRMGNMTFEPRADWHQYKLKKLPSPLTDDLTPFMRAIDSLKQYGLTLLEEDANRYRTSIFAADSHKFLSTIMTSGTLNDKVSALTLAVQQSPVHNIRAYDTLMTLASKKSRAQAIGAIDALVDLLGRGSMLPGDRRLRTFQNQPGLLGTMQKESVKTWSQGQPLPGKITQEHLVSWVFEDWLKSTYFKVIQLLEAWCTDEIEYSRMRAVNFVYTLLKEKPEQEANLMTLLVNKLGDRDRKIASRASYLLLQIQNSHPGMKPIIVRTVEKEILLHPSQDARSKYYAVNTLNQTILSSKEPSLAESLVKIYFDLFVALLKTGSLGISFGQETEPAPEEEVPLEETAPKPTGKKRRQRGATGRPAPTVPETEAADKLVSSLLTGVNRAAPFVGANDTVLETHLDTLFKIAHSTNFNTSIQALVLIERLSTARALATDRFYRTLYESLLDPRLVTSSKQSLYLNLLLRSLKNDVDVRRVKAFVKRMLQIAGVHQPPFVCGLLYVIAQLRQSFPDLSTLIDEPEESIFDDDEDEKAQRPVYDGRKRNPEHSNAQQSCLWEMIPYQAHFHPSVNVFAQALLDKSKKVEKPDLESHSLIRFLDKFVYRNPKTTDGAKGASIMQPLHAGKDIGNIWLGSRGAGTGTTQVNTAAFWNKKVEDVAAEDVFFHEYFQSMSKEPKKPKAKAADDSDSEAEDAAEEAGDEDEIWKALVSTKPEVGGDDSDEEGFDDFDDEEMASLADDSSDGGVDIEGSDDEEVDIEGSDEDMGDDMDGVVEDDDDDDDEMVPFMDDSESDKEDKSSNAKNRRKMLKGLPMFASVDDYAEMLANEEEM